jgi:hypothetical protein
MIQAAKWEVVLTANVSIWGWDYPPGRPANPYLATVLTWLTTL